MSIATKFHRSIARRGLLGTAGHAWRSLQHRLWERTSTAQRMREAQRAAEVEYDREHNVDTGGWIDLKDLSIGSANWQYGAVYKSIAPAFFHQLIAKACIADFSNYQFIDLGCGKGRTLLMAAEYPFRSIEGVEFAPELAAVARRNLRDFRCSKQQCRMIDVYCEDAATYEFPPVPTLLFLNNPFDHHVMAGVVESVCRSLCEHPRGFIVLYKDPDCGALWDHCGMFQKVQSARHQSNSRGILSWLVREMVDSDEIYAVWKNIFHRPLD